MDLDLVEWNRALPLEERIRVHPDRLATIREDLTRLAKTLADRQVQ